MSEVKYFNFPVCLLSGFLVDPVEVLRKIGRYSVYKYSLISELSFEDAAHFFGITFNHPAAAQKEAELIHSDVPANSPFVGISLTQYSEFYNNHKTEFECATLLAFLALKSIIQDKRYMKLDNRYFLARMDGKSHACDFKALSKSIRKYANEYQTKKLKTALSLSYGLKTYGFHTRGFYISFTLDLEDLIYHAELRRKSIKVNQLKNDTEEARKRALERLRNDTSKASHKQGTNTT